MSLLRLLSPKNSRQLAALRYYGSEPLGEQGSGVGHGGGGGGSIRSAGGAFGKMEVAHEEEYFYKKQREQLAKLKHGLHDEIGFHEEQIKRHQEAIERSKKRIKLIETEPRKK